MPRKRKKARSADTVDKYEVYELSVQEPMADCEFIDQVWKELRGSRCRSIREDFCGTAINSIEWVRRHPAHTAVGVDLDPEVLAVAKRRVAKRLRPEQRHRLQLLQENVLTAATEPVDSVLAFNFSYYIFKTRAKMKRYFKAVHRGLAEGGIFLLDAYGGSDAFVEMKETRPVEDFTYIWDQNHYNPVTGDVINYIHFRFKDGSKLQRAFTYEWRLWTLPELKELLKEAGFRQVHVYWEGTDEDGEGNGEFAVTTVGEACRGWIAYLVAEA